MSWNFDLSAEYYLNADSLFSAAIYFKRFQGDFQNVLVNETYTVDGRTVVVPVAVPQTSDETSDITGFELTAAHRFSTLPRPFDGLGFKASYNYADSTFETEDLRLGDQIDAATGVVTPGIVDPVNIFGLSKHVFSGSVYYELGPLELQLIAKHRAGYYQQFVGAASQNRVVRDATVIDFRASYRVNDNLSLSFEGSNLNNEPRVEDMPIPGSVREVHLYGPRYYLGARYRF
jgi:iron complex outermembrane recepter protein